jgi:hypothetical protein
MAFAQITPSAIIPCARACAFRWDVDHTSNPSSQAKDMH